MVYKTYIIIRNFISSATKKELADILLVPFFITIFIYFLVGSSLLSNESFLSNFNSLVISTASILVSFGIASLSAIISSSSPNIEAAQNFVTDRVDRNNKYINYYKLQILRNFFSLFILFGLLIFSIIMIFVSLPHRFMLYLYYFQIYLLLLSIYSQIFVIQSLYFLFVDNKKIFK